MPRGAQSAQGEGPSAAQGGPQAEEARDIERNFRVQMDEILRNHSFQGEV